MTSINHQELDKLTRLDQVLMWCIISINKANLNPKNMYVNDSAVIREESKNYINGYVTQDDKGNGRFVFSALLPIVNPEPLQAKRSLLERVWSYSPFDQKTIVEEDILGFGWPKLELHPWINTAERLLAHCAIIGSKISKYARLTKLDPSVWDTTYTQYWADVQYKIEDSLYGGTLTITGYLTIDHNAYLSGKSLIECLNPWSGHASDVSCNFPNLMQLWNVGDVDLTLPKEDIMTLIPSQGVAMEGEGTAGALLDRYEGKYFMDEAVPDWFQDALNGYQDKAENYANSSADIGNSTPRIIESLPVCKEQDPSVADYMVSLADKIQT